MPDRNIEEIRADAKAREARVRGEMPLQGEVTTDEITKQIAAIYKPRGPRRVQEWVMTIILIGCVIWPVVFGKPLSSTGSVQLSEAGLHPRHLAVAMGFLGVARLAILIYHGSLNGWCPWIRAGLAILCAFIWCQFLVANAFAVQTRIDTPVAVPIYFGLLIGEFLCCVRAAIDARYPSRL